MTSERVNKLLFIQLNLRVLQRSLNNPDIVDLDEIDNQLLQADN